MSNSKNSNSPTPMSGSENSQDNQPMAISASETSHETQSIPMSDSSINVHERPLKRVKTVYNNLNFMAQESLQQVTVTTGSAQENPTDIAMPSQENATDTAGLSQAKQAFPLVCSFNHARHLKFAIQALCDPVLDNPEELGRIDADVNGFNVTVQNSSNNVVAHLCFKTSEFSCTKPIEGKIVNLHELYKRLTDLEDDNGCTIIQEEEIDDLTFFAVARGFQDSVSLLENNAEISKFPEMSVFCKAVIPDAHFSKMLKHLLQQATHQVLVEIAENSETLMMSLMVKIEDSWKQKYPMMMQVAGMQQGVEPEKSYCASFQWINAQWLNKVSDMDIELEVSLHIEPRTYIVLSFKIKDVGYLEYMKIPIP
ncbi:uncharacterized protein LOC141595598 [Silene latifolia]|uniref:uncharacterized protein LOC141595598 n=1 Tax=Silene latifolia TaxID=37657 RepID=UPI003D789248